jgi:hypothetical protein
MASAVSKVCECCGRISPATALHCDCGHDFSVVPERRTRHDIARNSPNAASVLAGAAALAYVLALVLPVAELADRRAPVIALAPFFVFAAVVHPGRELLCAALLGLTNVVMIVTGVRIAMRAVGPMILASALTSAIAAPFLVTVINRDGMFEALEGQTLWLISYWLMVLAATTAWWTSRSERAVDRLPAMRSAEVASSPPRTALAERAHAIEPAAHPAPPHSAATRPSRLVIMYLGLVGLGELLLTVSRMPALAQLRNITMLPPTGVPLQLMSGIATCGAAIAGAVLLVRRRRSAHVACTAFLVIAIADAVYSLTTRLSFWTLLWTPVWAVVGLIIPYLVYRHTQRLLRAGVLT